MFFFFQAEDGIRDSSVTGVQTCALPIVSDGVVRLAEPQAVVPTLACSTSGEMVKESPKGLVRMVGRKLGAMPRPRRTVPKPPDRPTLASREKYGSPSKRPALPVSTRMKAVSWK